MSILNSDIIQKTNNDIERFNNVFREASNNILRDVEKHLNKNYINALKQDGIRLFIVYYITMKTEGYMCRQRISTWADIDNIMNDIKTAWIQSHPASKPISPLPDDFKITYEYVDYSLSHYVVSD